MLISPPLVTAFGQVEHNLVIDGPAGFLDEAAMDFRLGERSIISEKLPGFKKIPFEKIGPAAVQD